METLTANEAKTHFGDMLMKAQRAPVRINKNGKPVVVVISAEEYEAIETLKLQLLQARASQARADIEASNLSSAEPFFSELLSGHYD